MKLLNNLRRADINGFFHDKFYFLIILIISAFYFQFLFFGKLPIPADTIVGMYHPFRDKVWDNYVSGVPFKNPLITDPVRQQYVWRDLAVSQLKNGHLPVWNPYSFSGTPLLANFQTAAFYPLNLIYLIFPSDIAWTFQIIISHLLTGLLLYKFLKNLKLSSPSAFLGSIAFSFSGFSVSWLTWNTILHVAAWTILTLLSVDKIIQKSLGSARTPFIWYFIFIISLVLSFLAGHLQIFFYSQLLIVSYFLFRIASIRKNRMKVIIFIVTSYVLFFIFSSPQSIPAFQFINDSSRSIDQQEWNKPGWFIPWENLIQFIAPDYYGNPSTGNYFGVWNYGEFVGFIGVLPLILALYAVVFLRTSTINFFVAVFLISLLFALPTALSKLPFIYGLPLISTAQPTRLIYLISFSLSVLSAFGLDYFLKSKNRPVLAGRKQMLSIITFIFLLLLFLWFTAANPVSRRNLILPAVMFFATSGILIMPSNRKLIPGRFFTVTLITGIVMIISIADLLRFAWKFTPFTKKTYLFPETEITRILSSDKSLWRLMALDRRIMPPNFSVFYRFQDVAGYDPLFLKNYNIFISSWNANAPQSVPGSFNRIVTPENENSFITDLLNVKYILSFSQLDPDRFKLIVREGQTSLYINNNYFPRAWLADNIIKVPEGEELTKIFDLKSGLISDVVTSQNLNIKAGPGVEADQLEIRSWSENRIVIKTKTESSKVLVLSEIYHPSWKVIVDGKIKTIYKVNYLLRGIPLTPGGHIIELYPEIL